MKSKGSHADMTKLNVTCINLDECGVSEDDDSTTIQDIMCKFRKHPVGLGRNPSLLSSEDDLSQVRQGKRKRKRKGLKEILSRNHNSTQVACSQDGSPQSSIPVVAPVTWLKTGTETGGEESGGDRKRRAKVGRVPNSIVDTARKETPYRTSACNTPEKVETSKASYSSQNKLHPLIPAKVEVSYDQFTVPSSAVRGVRSRSNVRESARKVVNDGWEDFSLPLSGFHTCGDAKNCQDTCREKHVLRNLDKMSEEDLRYWYKDIMGSYFVSRNGEMVRGRLRRVIRTKVKEALRMKDSPVVGHCPVQSSKTPEADMNSAASSRDVVAAHLSVSESPESKLLMPNTGEASVCTLSSAFSYDQMSECPSRPSFPSSTSRGRVALFLSEEIPAETKPEDSLEMGHLQLHHIGVDADDPEVDTGSEEVIDAVADREFCTSSVVSELDEAFDNGGNVVDVELEEGGAVTSSDSSEGAKCVISEAVVGLLKDRQDSSKSCTSTDASNSQPNYLDVSEAWQDADFGHRRPADSADCELGSVVVDTVTGKSEAKLVSSFLVAIDGEEILDSTCVSIPLQGLGKSRDSVISVDEAFELGHSSESRRSHPTNPVESKASSSTKIIGKANVSNEMMQVARSLSSQRSLVPVLDRLQLTTVDGLIEEGTAIPSPEEVSDWTQVEVLAPEPNSNDFVSYAPGSVEPAEASVDVKMLSGSSSNPQCGSMTVLSGVQVKAMGGNREDESTIPSLKEVPNCTHLETLAPAPRCINNVPSATQVLEQSEVSEGVKELRAWNVNFECTSTTSISHVKVNTAGVEMKEATTPRPTEDSQCKLVENLMPVQHSVHGVPSDGGLLSLLNRMDSMPSVTVTSGEKITRTQSSMSCSETAGEVKSSYLTGLLGHTCISVQEETPAGFGKVETGRSVKPKICPLNPTEDDMPGFAESFPWKTPPSLSLDEELLNDEPAAITALMLRSQCRVESDILVSTSAESVKELSAGLSNSLGLKNSADFEGRGIPEECAVRGWLSNWDNDDDDELGCKIQRSPTEACSSHDEANFEFSSLQEVWTDAAKFFEQNDASDFEVDGEGHCPRKRKSHDADDGGRVKRAALCDTSSCGIAPSRARRCTVGEVPEGSCADDDSVVGSNDGASSAEHTFDTLSRQDEGRKEIPDESNCEESRSVVSKVAVQDDGVIVEGVQVSEAPKCEDALFGVHEASPEDVSSADEIQQTANKSCGEGLVQEHVDAVIWALPMSEDSSETEPGQGLLLPTVPDPVLVDQQPLPPSVSHASDLTCDSGAGLETPSDSDAAGIDLLACDKLGEEDDVEEYEPPSKLPPMRKTISPLSTLKLLRKSKSNSSPQRLPPIRLKLPSGRARHHGGLFTGLNSKSTRDWSCMDARDVERTQPTIVVNSFAPNSSDEDTADSSEDQELNSRTTEDAGVRLSLALSPSSKSIPSQLRNFPSEICASGEGRVFPPSVVRSPKGILKTGSQFRKCRECAELRLQTQTASEFIASQMKTFGEVAGRLTHEIQGLRTLLEAQDSSVADVNDSSPEKVQIIARSKVVERSAEKNLATLLRDCKRFCKLTAKRHRKIIFADEAGKKLCQIKTFETPPNLARPLWEIL